MNPGKVFESDFINSLPKEIFRYRLRDSAGTWQGGENTRFTQSNICDFIVHNGKWLYLLELKSHKGKSIPLSCFRQSQIDGLIKAVMYSNVNALLVLNFRDLKETYVLTIADFERYKLIYPDKKSIQIAWIKEHGELIPQTLKKVHYNYDLSMFCEVS